MKYSEEEQLVQILLRGEALRKRKETRAVRGLSIAAAVLLWALAVSVGSLERRGFAETETVYGSFLLSAEIGGYVLVAVLAFAGGIVVAVLIHRHQSRDGPKDFPADYENDV